MLSHVLCGLSTAPDKNTLVFFNTFVLFLHKCDNDSVGHVDVDQVIDKEGDCSGWLRNDEHIGDCVEDTGSHKQPAMLTVEIWDLLDINPSDL